MFEIWKQIFHFSNHIRAWSKANIVKMWRSLNPNQTEGQGNEKKRLSLPPLPPSPVILPPLIYFVSYFLVTHPNFMKLGTFPKIYLGLIFCLFFFFQNSNWFLQYQHFFTTRCYFLYVFCWKNEYILHDISRIWVKKVNDFSNDTLPIDTGIINLFHYMWGVWFIHKNS